MRSKLVVVLTCVLVPACVQRGVGEGPPIGLGDSPTMGGKDTFPSVDDDDGPFDSESGSDTDGETKGEVTGPPDADASSDAGEDSSSGEPAFDASTGGGDESTSGAGNDDLPEPPPGEPMWALCSDNDDCESNQCVIVHSDGTPSDGYCTATCNNPTLDCANPGSGTASRICIGSAEGVSICALDCSAPATCPNGMECASVEQSAVPVCI